MYQPGQSIFRAEALERRARGQEQVVFPRLVAPPVFAGLWLLLGLVLAALAAAWWATVPVYVAGTAVVPDPAAEPARAGSSDLVVFFPPEVQPALQVGQPLLIKAIGPAGAATLPPATIVAVEPDLVGPAAARRRFGLSGAAAAAISQPATVAVARFGLPAPAGAGRPAGAIAEETNQPAVDAAALAGTVWPAEVEVGSRRVLTLLPGLGALAGGG